MANENGTWIMHGLDWDNPYRIRTYRELINWINEIGFLPLFKNEVEGFSAEEHELKFVSQLNHEHYLQCACYMIAQNKENGILWNTRTNEMWAISIPDKQKFMDAVVKAITKRQLTKYYTPRGKKNGGIHSSN